tara:strand:+ start:176 stop:400 length:225 start_codon:yes stop_codon:yes gene_type:complete
MIGANQMLVKEARKIVGNQPMYAIKNMHKALSLHSWLNTPEENKRLEACKIILKYDNQKNEILNWVNQSGYNER